MLTTLGLGLSVSDQLLAGWAVVSFVLACDVARCILVSALLNPQFARAIALLNFELSFPGLASGRVWRWKLAISPRIAALLLSRCKWTIVVTGIRSLC